MSDMLVFSDPRQVIKEREIATMDLATLRSSREALQRVLRRVDAAIARREALAASDQSTATTAHDDADLDRRVADARRALGGVRSDAGTQPCAEAVKARLREQKS